MKAILKKSIFLAAVALTCVFVACDDKTQEINYTMIPGNELYTPIDKSLVNLDMGLPTTFQWAPSKAEDGGYVTYEVLFDKPDGDFSNPIAVLTSQGTGSQAQLSITAKEMNVIAELAGIENAKSGDIKWTVRVGKGLNPVNYSQVNTSTFTRINLVLPVPTAVQFDGTALENSTLKLNVAAGIDGKASEEGVFECFTKIGSGDTFVSDEKGRIYELRSNGKIKYLVDAATPFANQIPSGLSWIKLDFTSMTWSSIAIAQMDLQACNDAVFSQNGWPGCDWKMTFKMTYDKNGVWTLMNYPNKMSVKKDGTPADSRHKFKMTLASGDTYWFGGNIGLGDSYTDEYLKCHLFTNKGVGNTDWDHSFNFLNANCGVAFDGYLKLNADGPQGAYCRQYNFK